MKKILSILFILMLLVCPLTLSADQGFCDAKCKLGIKNKILAMQKKKLKSQNLKRLDIAKIIMTKVFNKSENVTLAEAIDNKFKEYAKDPNLGVHVYVDLNALMTNIKYNILAEGILGTADAEALRSIESPDGLTDYFAKAIKDGKFNFNDTKIDINFYFAVAKTIVGFAGGPIGKVAEVELGMAKWALDSGVASLKKDNFRNAFVYDGEIVYLTFSKNKTLKDLSFIINQSSGYSSQYKWKIEEQKETNCKYMGLSAGWFCSDVTLKIKVARTLTSNDLPFGKSFFYVTFEEGLKTSSYYLPFVEDAYNFRLRTGTSSSCAFEYKL